MSLDSVNRTEREAIRIVVADPDRQLRLALRQALIYAGFKTVDDMGTAAALEDLLDEGMPDLLLVSARLPDGDGCDIVRALRHARRGRNPFLSIILTAWPDEVDDPARLIASGTDHVILKPVAPKAVFDRMAAMIERRKPFVATATYLGPDRRGSARAEDAAPIPTFEVPNSLRLRALGKPVDPTMLQRAIDASMERINGEMTRRQAFHLNFLIERAVPLLAAGKPAGPAVVDQIGIALREMARRLAPDQAHVVELCRNLDGHLGAALDRTDGGAWDEHDVLVLRKLGQAIYVGLHPRPDLEHLAREIGTAVGSFEARQRRRKAPYPSV